MYFIEDLSQCYDSAGTPHELFHSSKWIQSRPESVDISHAQRNAE
jgi:hypothetical protein